VLCDKGRRRPFVSGGGFAGYALDISDSASLLFIIATSFLPRSELSRALDLAFGLAFLPELMSRLAGVRNS